MYMCIYIYIYIHLCLRNIVGCIICVYVMFYARESFVVCVCIFLTASVICLMSYVITITHGTCYDQVSVRQSVASRTKRPCVMTKWNSYDLTGLPVHLVSITRFPLRKFSPGAGLLRNPFVHR